MRSYAQGANCTRTIGYRACPCRLHRVTRSLQPVKAVIAGDAPPKTSSAAPKKDPFAEKTIYNDTPVDLAFIGLFTRRMADQLEGVRVPLVPTYEDFVRVSKEIMKGRTAEQQREVVRDVLRSLLPEAATSTFKRLFPPTRLSAELNALFASLGFFWLVGKMDVQAADIQVGPSEVRRQRSMVQIKKCRYLEASGCVGLCVNMCKIPTQDFFINDFGLPLTMEPNFEDLSCKMIFGQVPLPLSEDPAFKQPCFKLQCSMSEREKQIACPKLDNTKPLPSWH